MLVDLGFDLPAEVIGGDDRGVRRARSAPSEPPTWTTSAPWCGSTSAPTQPVKKVFEQTTTAHKEGRWFDISEADGDYYVAHSFVTPLSIPYVLERYVPQLAAAADGDPATVPPRPLPDRSTDVNARRSILPGLSDAGC